MRQIIRVNMQMTQEIQNRIEQIRRGEVPDGYKKTKVGIVPAEWTVCNMGEIYSERKESGDPTLPILTVSIHSGVSNGELDESELGKKVKRIEDKTQYLTARKGDLVFNMMRAWQGAIGVVQADGLVSPAYIVAKPTVKVCSAFMDEYIKLSESINRLRKKSYGVTDFRLRLYWDSFVKVECCIPTLAEQDKIAEILTAQDRVIELCEKKVDELKKLKKAFLQKMFPKPGSTVPEWRFPEFTDAWEQRKVADLFRITRGYVLAAPLTSNNRTDDMPYPVYSSQTKDNGLMGYYKDYLYEDAITWTTDGANAGTVNYRPGKFYCTNVCGVLLADKVKPDQMLAEALNNVARGHVSYVGNPKLMNNVMAEIPVSLPSDERERTLISSFFADVDNLITLHQRKCDEEKQKKKALMQLLLTGIVRVTTDEEVTICK